MVKIVVKALHLEGKRKGIIVSDRGEKKSVRVETLGVASFLQYKFKYPYNLPIFLNKIIKMCSCYPNLETDFYIENISDSLRHEIKKLENQLSKTKRK